MNDKPKSSLTMTKLGKRKKNASYAGNCRPRTALNHIDVTYEYRDSRDIFSEIVSLLADLRLSALTEGYKEACKNALRK